MARAYWMLPEPSLGGCPSGYLPDGSWGGWVPTHFSGKGRWVAGEEPKELEFVDGVLCEVVYALDKQLRWIEKNIQPGTKRVQARLRAQDLAMKNGDNERVVEARPVQDPPRPLVNPPARVARGAGPEPWPRHLHTKPRHRLDTSTPHANSTNSTPLDTPRHHLG